MGKKEKTSTPKPADVASTMGVGAAFIVFAACVLWYHQGKFWEVHGFVAFIMMIAMAVGIGCIVEGVIIAVTLLWPTWARLTENEEYVVRVPPGNRIIAAIWKAALTIGLGVLLWDKFR